MLISAALVLFMTIPGLALFYGWAGPIEKRAWHADAEFHHGGTRYPAMVLIGYSFRVRHRTSFFRQLELGRVSPASA